MLNTATPEALKAHVARFVYPDEGSSAVSSVSGAGGRLAELARMAPSATCRKLIARQDLAVLLDNIEQAGNEDELVAASKALEAGKKPWNDLLNQCKSAVMEAESAVKDFGKRQAASPSAKGKQMKGPSFVFGELIAGRSGKKLDVVEENAETSTDPAAFHPSRPLLVNLSEASRELLAKPEVKQPLEKREEAYTKAKQANPSQKPRVARKFLPDDAGVPPLPEDVWPRFFPPGHLVKIPSDILADQNIFENNVFLINSGYVDAMAELEYLASGRIAVEGSRHVALMSFEKLLKHVKDTAARKDPSPKPDDVWDRFKNLSQLDLHQIKADNVDLFYTHVQQHQLLYVPAAF